MIFYARAGQLAKGFIYFVMALLAANLIWSGKGDPGGSREAIRAVAAQPFGRILLLALIGGLICYILARLLDALVDLERRGRDAKGLLLRARSLLIAVVYGGLTAAAVSTVLGDAAGGRDHSAQDWTARVLQTPFGTWSVMLIGLGIIASGIVLTLRGYTGAFEEKLTLNELQAGTRRWGGPHLCFRADGPRNRLRHRREFPCRRGLEIKSGTGARTGRRPRRAPRPALRAVAFRDGRRRAGRLRRLLRRAHVSRTLGQETSSMMTT